MHLSVLSTGEPTYWPTNIKKIPGLIYFFVGKGISAPNVSCNSCHDLSSDHLPIILHLERDIKRYLPPCHLNNSKTNWALFENHVDDFIDIRLSLKTEGDITNAVEHFNTSVRNSVWSSTPQLYRNNSSLHNVPANISDLIAAERNFRKNGNKRGFHWTKSI